MTCWRSHKEWNRTQCRRLVPLTTKSCLLPKDVIPHSPQCEWEWNSIPCPLLWLTLVGVEGAQHLPGRVQRRAGSGTPRHMLTGHFSQDALSAAFQMVCIFRVTCLRHWCLGVTQVAMAENKVLAALEWSILLGKQWWSSWLGFLFPPTQNHWTWGQ